MIRNRNLIFSSAIDSSDDEDQYIQLPKISNASLPTASTSNEGGIAYDSTNNKVVVSNGSSWETVTSS